MFFKNRKVIEDLNDTIDKLTEKLDQRTGELSKEKRKREKADADLHEANKEISHQTAHNQDLKEQLVLAIEEKTKLSNAVSEMTEESYKTFTERDYLKDQLEKISEKYKSISGQKGGLVKEINKLKEELAKSVNIISDLNAEVSKNKKRPEVPTIADLKTYQENPKLLSRKRKNK